MTSVPGHVGVYGGGRMGAGIAHAFLASGATVTVVEADQAAADAARERVHGTLAKADQIGKLGADLAEVQARLAVASDASAFAGSDLVVEAVPEIPDLKKKLLASVAQVAPGAVIATNTSSLSVDDLASSVDDPTRFIGLHFFNPVPASELVEIVVGAHTSADLVTQAQGWVDGLGKTGIVVKDSPGFASSRLGVAIAIEAMRMVEEGVASAEDIDIAMQLGYKHPMGPLKTTDLVGLDVRLAIAEYLASTLGSRFEPPQVLRDKVERGELGRKTGQGFYTW